MNTIEKRIKDDVLEKGYLIDNNVLAINKTIKFEDFFDFILKGEKLNFEYFFKNKDYSFDDYLETDNNIYDYLKSTYSEEELSQLVYETDKINDKQKKWLDINLKLYIKNEFFDNHKFEIQFSYPNYIVPKNIFDKNMINDNSNVDITNKNNLVAVDGKEFYKKLKEIYNNTLSLNLVKKVGKIIEASTKENTEYMSLIMNDVNFKVDNKLKKIGVLNENGDLIQTVYNFSLDKDVVNEIYKEHEDEWFINTRNQFEDNILNKYQEELVTHKSQTKKDLLKKIKINDNIFDYSTLVEFVKKNIDNNPKTLVMEDLQDKVCDYLVNNKKIAVTIDKKTLNYNVINDVYDKKTNKLWDKIIEKIKSVDIPNKIYSSDYCTINENIEKILRDKNIIDKNNVQHIVSKDFENGKITITRDNLDDLINYLYYDDEGKNFELDTKLLTQDEFKEYLAKIVTSEELYYYNYFSLYWQINPNRHMLLAFDDVDMSVEDSYCIQSVLDECSRHRSVDEIMEYTKKEIRDWFEQSVWYIVEKKYGERNEENLANFYNNITKEDLNLLSVKFENKYDASNPCIELQERLDIKLKYNITKDDIDLSLISDYFKKENIEERKQEEATKKTKKILKI